MTRRWYQEAVVYCLEVASFQDSDGDGVGDLRGLISRLDYLARLGVTCLWLNPIHPSPRRDNGYDVSDYYGIDPRLGTLGDFAELTRRGRASAASGSCSTWWSTTRPTSTRGSSPPAATRPRRTGTGTCGAIPSLPTGSRVWSSPASRRRPGPSTSRPARGTSTASTTSSPTSTGRNPRCPGRDRQGHGLLAPAGRVRLPDRRGAVRPRAGLARGRPGAAGLLDPGRVATGRRSGSAVTRCCCARPTSTPTKVASLRRQPTRRPERPGPDDVRLPAEPEDLAGAGPAATPSRWSRR